MLANRYAILETIGFGGMGAVYLSRDLHFPNARKLVAVKEMINQSLDKEVQKTTVQNFEREANILGALSHPAVPVIYDYFSENERTYLILEYIEGKDLETLLEEAGGPLPENQVIGWAIELCDVLAYLHHHTPEKIIFRDLKPSNVMINQLHHVVLIDFGIAKNFQMGQKQTMIGTEGYAPPEQYRGEVTEASDIYALGATLHHLVTGRDPRLEPPFTFLERPVRRQNPAISAQLEEVIMKALQYDAAKRYPSAQAMREALAAAARENGNTASGRSQSQTVEPQTTNVLVWTFQCEDEIRASPLAANGNVYFGSYDQHLYALNAGSGEMIWKYRTEGGIACQPVIHEGIVYFGSEDNRVFALIERTGRLTWAYATNGPVRCSPTLAQNHIVIGSDDGCLHAVNIATGRSAWICNIGCPIRSKPVIANDVICFGTEGGDVVAVDFSGKVRWEFKTKRPVTGGLNYSQGMIIFGSLDANLYALDAKSGLAVWRFRMGKGTATTPACTESLVFMGSADQYIYCVDKRSGREAWKFKTGNQVSGSALVYRDSIICGSADGCLYRLDTKRGNLMWNFQTKGAITSTPSIQNDILYIGSNDHTFYAIKL